MFFLLNFIILKSHSLWARRDNYEEDIQKVAQLKFKRVLSIVQKHINMQMELLEEIRISVFQKEANFQDSSCRGFNWSSAQSHYHNGYSQRLHKSYLLKTPNHYFPLYIFVVSLPETLDNWWQLLMDCPFRSRIGSMRVQLILLGKIQYCQTKPL